jgi:transposase-like protein
MPESTNLGSKKEAAIVALLSQRNIAEAARTAGLSERTLYRWLKDPTFDAAYRDARRSVYSQSMARAQQMSTAAVTTLGVIMLDANAPPATRIRAADCVLNHAGKAIDREDIFVRLSELERREALRRKWNKFSASPRRRNRIPGYPNTSS